MRRKMRGYRIPAVIVMFAMVACMLPMNAKAQEEITADGIVTTVVPDAEVLGLEDNDTLFEGYIQKQTFYGDASTFSMNYAESVLDELNYAIYLELKAQIAEIASAGGSTKFTISSDVFAGVDLTVDVDESSQMAPALSEKLYAVLERELIMQCLLIDCPYEMYWFDKSVTWSTSFGYSYYEDTWEAWITNISFKFQVADGYRTDPYDVNSPAVTENVSRVTTAVQNAKQVVETNKDLTDREKLYAYKEFICAKVEYNHDAAGGNAAYGDPWQLIYVFDQDDTTKVVCEGYSKAFQYLCELSEFYDDDFASYLVSGPMYTYDYVTEQWSGAGHMWNIVTLGGVNYLVDVTNSEPGTIGQGGELFMALNPTDGTADVYTILIDQYNAVQYQYDDAQKVLYGEGIRALGEEMTYCLKTDDNISVDTGKYMKAGVQVTPSVVCERGYRLKEYLLNDTPVVLEDGMFIMPDEDSVLTAVYEQLKLGDMNDDGSITEVDIQTLRRYFVGEFTFEDSYVAEFFGTDEINSITLIRLRKYLDHQISDLETEI